MASVLIVEDEANMARSLSRILERRGYGVGIAAEGNEALGRLDSEPFDVVITDLKMPGMGGMELLVKMHERGHRHPTIVLTGFGTVQGAVEAMKLGAADYLIKPYNPDELLLIVERQLEQRALRLENARLREQVRRERRFGEMVGSSVAMHDLYRVVDAVSQNRSSVLLIGESGTGKELVARTLHDRSPFAEKPFLAVNCAGMSETLIDSQLFGHKRGAFTGAIADHEGVFQAAAGGTLFLDEVFEIPLTLQPKFLRAIQEREVTPIGSNKPIAVDVRIVAATNRDLEREVGVGAFRADLFYRLNVVTLRLPPLRERKEDIPLLVDHFVREFGNLYRVEPKVVTEAAAEALARYDWPGNVRELQNAIERAFALSREAAIDFNDLPPAVRGDAPRAVAAGMLDGNEVPRLADVEEKVIRAALDRTGGNKNQAARLLGIDRQRLYRKIAKYGIS
ncbi:MAG: sigma-54-dependent transcriptional regulator [Candidatus Binatia bacterium]